MLPFYSFPKESHSVTQAGFRLKAVLLPQHPKCWIIGVIHSGSPPWLLLFLRKFRDWHISMCTRKWEQESRFQVWVQRQASYCLDHGCGLGLIYTSCAQSSDLSVECRWLLGGGVWLFCHLSVYRFQVTCDQRFCSMLFSSAIKTDLSPHSPPLVF